MVGKVIHVGGWISLAGFSAFVVLALLYWNFGFQAMECTHARNPAINVQVTTDRRGHVAERHLLGCTFYSYAAPSPDEVWRGAD